MKYMLSNTVEIRHHGGFVARTALSEHSIAAVLHDDVLRCYFLVVQTQLANEQQRTEYFELPFITDEHFKYSLRPLTLFAWDGKPCVMLDKTKAYYFHDFEQAPKSIAIDGVDEWTEDLFINRQGFHTTTLSDTDLMAIGMKQRGGTLDSPPRWFGLLKMDSHALSLRWVYTGTIQAQTALEAQTSLLSTLGQGLYEPKVDSLMIRDNTLHIVCPGVSDSNVERWGMDFYCIASAKLSRSDKGVEVGAFKTEYESTHLSLMSPKKSGAYGFFSASADAVVFTPLFSNDDWKGKPKRYDFATKTLQDIALPRGMSKGYILQLSADFLWYVKTERQINADAPWPITQTILHCLRFS
jgi:hypothetical protein